MNVRDSFLSMGASSPVENWSLTFGCGDCIRINIGVQPPLLFKPKLVITKDLKNIVLLPSRKKELVSNYKKIEHGTTNNKRYREKN